MQFIRLTVNEGLSQHDVSCVIQDSYGFVWIGTYDGLNRFDGYKVQNFFSITDNPGSLPSNRILCLFEDSKKRLWIGTDGEGICYIDLKTEELYRLETPSGFKGIKDIVENVNGDILVGTSNGVLRINERDEKLSVELLQLPLTGMMVNHLTIANSTVYFGTNNGIWSMNANSCKQISETKNIFITALSADQKGNIWAGAKGYLFRIKNNIDSISIKEIDIKKEIEIRALCVSGNNDVWAGTLDNGLFLVDDSLMTLSNQLVADTQTDRSLLSNTVLSLYCDQANTIWVGNRKGLCYGSLSAQKFSQLPVNTDEPSFKQVSTLKYDNMGIYFGIQNGGCFRYDLQTQKTVKYKLQKGVTPIHFFKYNNKVYLGTSSGLFRVGENSNELIHQPISTVLGNQLMPSIFSTCEDTFGRLYIGTYDGLIVGSGAHSDWAHSIFEQAEVLRKKRIFSLLYDQSANCIWIGTISEGLFKMNLSANGELMTIEQYNSSMKNSYNITNNTIWCFLKDKSGNIWLGTDSGLLYKPKDSNTFQQIKNQGVVDKKIMAIIEDDMGQLWLSNSQGIIFFSPESEIVEEYSYNDGLSTSSFTEAVDKDKNGNIYFGSIEGINFFNPNDIIQSTQINKVFITDFKVHHALVKPQKDYYESQILEKTINEADFIELNYKQNNFSFEFAGTNFLNANVNEFKYKLEGYDRKWIYTSGKHRFASYSNLDPGKYTFIVDAANHDGVWGNSPKQINIFVNPAPWKTVWAYLLYASLFIILTTVFIYFLYNRQILKQQLHLDHLNREKEQEIHELKLMFFTDVAHEFKTPLSLIIGPLNDLIHNKNTKETIDFCFQVISRNTQRMMFLVNQLLDFRKINANVSILNVRESKLSDFIHYTVEAFEWQAQNENIHFNVLTPDSFTCYFDHNILEKVLYNVISNAFKYTPENGIIELELKPVWKDNLQVANIIIRDSGKGIPDQEKNKIFERFFHGKHRYSSGIGLHLSYTLIKAHRGEMNVADSSYGGAEFILSIPVSKDFYAEGEISTKDYEQEYPTNSLQYDQKPNKEIGEERERILVVEDDHDLRTYLKNCLQMRYVVLEAVNGKDGFDKAMKNIPDIIVSDVMMPEMDGLEMCQKLKLNTETSHIPILMLTAKTDEVYQKKGLDSGAWDYISKPFNTSTLLQKIDNIIETRNKYKIHLLNQNITLEVSSHYTPFDQRFITRINEIIKDNISNSDFTVESLAVEIGFSRMQLHRKLKALVGETTTGYVNKIKMNYAKSMFDEGCDRIQETMDAVGINSYSHFNNTFKKHIGQSASGYIANLKVVDKKRYS